MNGCDVIIIFFFAAHGIVGSIYIQRSFVENHTTKLKAAAKIVTMRGQGAVALGYDVKTLESGITFAGQWSNDGFTSSISALYPGSFEYSIWTHNIMTWENGASGKSLTCPEILNLIDTVGLEIVVPALGTCDPPQMESP